MDAVKRVIELMTSTERRYAVALLGMIVIMALLDALGVASIMPFMAIIANPGLVDSNRYLSAIFIALGFKDTRTFLVFLGGIVFTMLVVSLAFKGLTTWAILRFTFACEYSLGRRLLLGYVHQPYEWFLNRHSASLGKTILSEVEQVVSGYFLPLMQCAAQAIASAVLLLLLVLVDPVLAFYIFMALGTAYALIFMAIRKRLAVLGRERVESNESRFEAVTEIFGGIKEIKVTGTESAFVQRYDTPAKRYAKHQASAKTAFFLPRYAMEAIAFGGMLLVAIYLVGMSDGLQGALPVLALYAMAGYRLMPALQQVFAYVSQLRFSYPALVVLHEDYAGLDRKEGCRGETMPMQPVHLVELEDVTYAYPGSDQPALNKLAIRIPVRSSIGLVGTTGSGKTTTVDVILGLLTPQSGSLKVDGQPITANDRSSWAQTVGYVPQHIFLSDDTIAANIAFGIPEQDINIEAVKDAAKLANLRDFIESNLPNGYFTKVGERGIRLSGGQRQRIGIARALYRRPQLLVLDEATSALDNRTEHAVMKAVQSLSRKLTIVLIAHRLSTVRACDTIYLLEHGSVIGQGSYDELLATNDKFKQMATVSSMRQSDTAAPNHQMG